MNKQTPPLSEEAENFKIGTYKHYKGNLYMAITIARLEENLEEVVVYQPLYDEEHVWVRPLKNFIEKVTVGDKETPRFSFIEE